MPTFNTPASTQAQQNAPNRSAARWLRRMPAPPATSTPAAARVASADSARLAGKPPGPQDQAVAPINKASAPSSGSTPRPGQSGAHSITKLPHRPKARAWFRKVGEGERL